MNDELEKPDLPEAQISKVIRGLRWACKPWVIGLLLVVVIGGGTAAYYGLREVDDPNAPHPRYVPFKAVAPMRSPIEDPPLKRITELTPADQIKDTDYVLGVTINGESRAYPLAQLTGPTREVFNDFLGDRPIMATW